MKTSRNRSLLVLLLLASLSVGACQSSKHTMVGPRAGQTVVCSKCYDQIRKAQSTGGPLGGLATNRTITTHVCEDCKTEMSIYTENGVTKVKCAKCAPEGLACDKCLPPKDYTRPKPANEPATK